MATAALVVTSDGATNRNELRQLGNSLIQLSDGTPVWLEYSGGEYLTIKAWPAHAATAVTIANKLTGAGRPVGGVGATYDGTVLALCRDAADNLYVIGRASGSGVLLVADAWVKGDGYTWTEHINATVIRSAASSTLGWVTASWANTGGGVDSAGHIVVGYALAGATRYAVLDAGKLLLGITGAVTSSGTLGAIEPSGNADISSDGHGALKGILAAASSVNANTITMVAWTVNAAGALTVTTLTAPPTTNDVGDRSRVRIVRYAPDRWALVYSDWFSPDYFRIRRYSSTGPVGASVPSGVPTNMPDALSTLPNATWGWLWDAQASPVEANVIRVFGQHQTTGNVWSVKADLTSGVAWDTVAVAEPHTYGGASPRGGMRAAKEPLATPYGDFQAYIHRTSVPDYRLLGDFHSYAAAPLKPTLRSPANASSLDVSLGVTFSWDYNPAETSGVQDAWALRIKNTSGGSYTYWNATTGTWGAALVWNLGAATSVTVPTGILNGSDYDWSAASRESERALLGPFADDARLLARAIPTLNVTAPTGTVTATADPPVTWVTTPAGGTAQVSYRLVVESGSYDVTPGAGTSAYDSGVVASSAQGAMIPVPLHNAVTYRFFVQVAQTGGQLSAWDYTDALISLSPPAAPTVDPVVEVSEGRVAVVVYAHDNLLAANPSDAEEGIDGWTASRATLSQNTSAPIEGSASLAITGSGAASSTAEATVGPMPVTAGETYDAQATFAALSTARTVRVFIDWLNSTGGVLSTTAGPAVSDATVVTSEVADVAPVGAVSALVRLSVATPANGETHLADKVGLFREAAPVTWTRGGFAGDPLPVLVERQQLDGSWVPVRYSEASTLNSAGWAVVYDYEAVPDQPTAYRARVIGDVSLSVASALSEEEPVVPTLDAAWLKDPLSPTRNVRLSCLDNVTPQRSRAAAVLQPLGAKYPVVQTDVRHAATFTVGVTPLSQEEYDAINVLLDDAGATLLLQRPAVSDGWRGLSFYLVASSDDTWTPLGDVPDDRGTLSFAATEVAAPAVT